MIVLPIGAVEAETAGAFVFGYVATLHHQIDGLEFGRSGVHLVDNKGVLVGGENVLGSDGGLAEAELSVSDPVGKAGTEVLDGVDDLHEDIELGFDPVFGRTMASAEDPGIEVKAGDDVLDDLFAVETPREVSADIAADNLDFDVVPREKVVLGFELVKFLDGVVKVGVNAGLILFFAFVGKGSGGLNLDLEAGRTGIMGTFCHVVGKSFLYLGNKGYGGEGFDAMRIVAIGAEGGPKEIAGLDGGLVRAFGVDMIGFPSAIELPNDVVGVVGGDDVDAGFGGLAGPGAGEFADGEQLEEELLDEVGNGGASQEGILVDAAVEGFEDGGGFFFGGFGAFEKMGLAGGAEVDPAPNGGADNGDMVSKIAIELGAIVAEPVEVLAGEGGGEKFGADGWCFAYLGLLGSDVADSSFARLKAGIMAGRLRTAKDGEAEFLGLHGIWRSA